MVIEDLHWIDSVAEELLSKIIDSEAKLRLLVLTTRRPEYSPPWLDRSVVTKLRLEALPAGDIRRLVQNRLGVEVLPEAFARQVTEKAEGNPLFAEEIVSYLTDRGIIRTTMEFDENALAAALPISVQSLLTARVDQLTSNDRALLQAASVIGRRFDPQLLAAVLSEDRTNADWYRLFLAEVYLQIIAGHEKPPILTLLRNLPILLKVTVTALLKVTVTAPSRIRALIAHVLENPHRDPAGHHTGRAGLALQGEEKTCART